MRKFITLFIFAALLAACATKRKAVTEAATTARTERTDTTATTAERRDTAISKTETVAAATTADTIREWTRTAVWTATDTIHQTDTVFTEVWHTITRHARDYIGAATTTAATAAATLRTDSTAHATAATNERSTHSELTTERTPRTYHWLAHWVMAALLAAALLYIGRTKK